MFVEDIPRQIFCLCNSGGCRTKGMSWKNGAWGDARLGASESAKKRSRENHMGILCLNIARRSARVDAEGLQFLRISSIRVAERKEGGSKTSPGRRSRRRCPPWNSPRLFFIFSTQCFDPSFSTVCSSSIKLWWPWQDPLGAAWLLWPSLKREKERERWIGQCPKENVLSYGMSIVFP